MGWVKTSESTNKLIIGNPNITTYVNGVLHTYNVTTFTSSAGWMHVRQVYYLQNQDYNKLLPALYGSSGDIIYLAMPAVFYGDVNMGLHKGLL
jgi:hypothetical protein